LATNPLNVLYISYDGMTDPLGQSQVIPYIKGLAKLGYRFTLLSCEKKDRFEKSKKNIQEILKESGIEWHPLIYHKSPPVLSTLYDFIRLRSTASRLHRNKKFQLVHCRSYISSMVGLYLKRNYQVPFIFDMRGFWADERVDGALWNLKNPLHKLIYNFFKNREKLFIKYSDAIVSLTEAGKTEMESWEICKNSNSRIDVIPCSADFDFFKKPDLQSINFNKSALGIPANSFVLSYLGSLGTWYMIDEMLDFFKILQRKYNNAVFLILTPDDPELVFSKTIEKGIDRAKIIIQFSSRKELINKVSVSDLSLFFIKLTYSKKSSSPTKLGELLAMEIPVICNSGIGDVDEIINSTGGGVVIDNFDDTNYSKAIESIPSLDLLDKRTMREKAKYYYDLEKSVNKYGLIYKRLLHHNIRG
jgi:glycosyltransferase involved in cell wall biosynthesis